MKKTLLIAVASFAALTLAANPLKGWSPTRSDLAKNNPGYIKTDAKSITLTGIPKITWNYFHAKAVNAAKGQKVEIKFKASGKGKVAVGFYEYRSGFNSTGINQQNVVLSNKMEEKTVTLTVKYNGSTIVRPAFFISPDGQIKLTQYSLKVVK